MRTDFLGLCVGKEPTTREGDGSFVLKQVLWIFIIEQEHTVADKPDRYIDLHTFSAVLTLMARFTGITGLVLLTTHPVSIDLTSHH